MPIVCVYTLDVVNHTLHQPGSAVSVLPRQQPVVFFIFGNIAQLANTANWKAISA